MLKWAPQQRTAFDRDVIQSDGSVLTCGAALLGNERHVSILQHAYVNPLAPNDVYIRRIAQLTSRRCILNIYSTNILTEYFKHAAHSPFFFSSRFRLFHNAIFFGSCNIHILDTGCAKILKKIPAPKG